MEKKEEMVALYFNANHFLNTPRGLVQFSKSMGKLNIKEEKKINIKNKIEREKNG